MSKNTHAPIKPSEATLTWTEQEKKTPFNSVYSLANPSAVSSKYVISRDGKDQSSDLTIDISDTGSSESRQKSDKKVIRISSIFKKKSKKSSDNEITDTSCCASPCFCICVKSLETATGIVVAAEFILSGLAMVFGVLCVINPRRVLETFALSGIIDSDDIQNLESATIRPMITGMGWIYFTFGLISVFITCLLLKAVKNQSSSYCYAWSLAKVISIILLLAGFAVVSFGQTTPGSESNAVNPGIAIFVMIALMLIPLYMYFFYIVSLYNTVLKIVDQKVELYKKLILDIEKKDEDDDDDDDEEEYEEETEASGEENQNYYSNNIIKSDNNAKITRDANYTHKIYPIAESTTISLATYDNTHNPQSITSTIYREEITPVPKRRRNNEPKKEAYEPIMSWREFKK